MIQLLHINEYVYLRNVDMYFSEGLNVITGETGTGKTLLLDILGAFLDYANLRSETFSADLVVNLPRDFEDSSGLELITGEHIFSVERKGRRLFFKVDGRLVNKEYVVGTFENLMAIHKQNSHMKLLDKKYVLRTLDQVAGDEEILGEYRKTYQEYVNVLKLLSTASVEETERVVSELSEKVDEIESAKLSVEEERELERRFREGTRLQTLSQSYGQALSQLEDVERILRKFYQLLDDELHPLVDSVIESAAELENSIRRTLDRVEEVDLESIEARLWTYRKLRRKYGPTTEDVLEALGRYKTELREKMRDLEVLKNAEVERRRLEHRLSDLSTKLRKMRLAAAEKLEGQIEKHLADLNMRAKIKFDFREVPFGPDGADEVELVGTTIGSGGLLPLRKIASGGELSRIMLALELSVASVPILVYDEIDAGVGGVTAVKLAHKLKQLSKTRQIIVVTHLPQIALLADKHFAVLRSDGSAEVRELDEVGRREEVKRMVGGELFLEKLLESVGVEDGD